MFIFDIFTKHFCLILFFTNSNSKISQLEDCKH